MAKITKKQLLSVFSFALSTIIFIFALVVFIMSIKPKAKNERVELFGYSFAVVVTNSMYPEIKAGDLIVVKSCDISDIQEGQNAVFIGVSGEYKDKSIVHRVIGVDFEIDENGNPGIILTTKGLANDFPDKDSVTADNFVGREIFHSAFLGHTVTFLRNPINWIYVLVILLVVYYVSYQIKKIVKLVKNKNSDTKATESKDTECVEATNTDTANEDTVNKDIDIKTDNNASAENAEAELNAMGNKELADKDTESK